LLEIIDGMEMDLAADALPRFQGVVALLLPRRQRRRPARRRNFRLHRPPDAKYAHDLGMAFQLTNIIRDIGEDARRGRIYIPMDELKQFNVPAADILNAKYSDNFTP
jgi:phytoene synthase